MDLFGLKNWSWTKNLYPDVWPGNHLMWNCLTCILLRLRNALADIVTGKHISHILCWRSSSISSPVYIPQDAVLVSQSAAPVVLSRLRLAGSSGVRARIPLAGATASLNPVFDWATDQICVSQRPYQQFILSLLLNALQLMISLLFIRNMLLNFFWLSCIVRSI